MAREIQHFTVTIPAGTPAGSPVAVAISTQVRTVSQIDWRVPNGPMGVFGWRIAMGGVQVFPSGGDPWVIANDENGSWPVSNAPDSGAWQVIGYNTGANPHSVYLAVHCDPVAPKQPVAAVLQPYQFMPAPDLSRAGPPILGRLWGR